MTDTAAFGKLADALSPWHAQLVFIGGWAHRLYRLDPRAALPLYAPLVTLDADVAFAERERLDGSIKARLVEAGFTQQLTGTHRPPISQYSLGDDAAGFYAEFLTPLTGSGMKRDKSPLVTVELAGVTAQRLRHLELLLLDPWHVEIPEDWGAQSGTRPQLPNPTSFMVQKLLIHGDRAREKRPQDVLYIHDTIELFADDFENLRQIWTGVIRPSMHANQIKSTLETTARLFAEPNDVVRSAAAIPQDRSLSAARMGQMCNTFLQELLA